MSELPPEPAWWSDPSLAPWAPTEPPIGFCETCHEIGAACVCPDGECREPGCTEPVWDHHYCAEHDPGPWEEQELPSW